MSNLLPRYPLYVPSKGRADQCQTVKFLLRDQVPFFLVVEPQEQQLYGRTFPQASLLVLPDNDQGLIYARNWIKAHATAAGHARHWQIDDNIHKIKRRYQGKRIPCHAGMALAITEQFVDRYTNVAVAGLNYQMFLPPNQPMPPFYLNVHVYSCTLVRNSLPYGWRARYNDDTDLCLRVLADGWCTVLMNCFLIDKITTMVIKGGNTTDLYQGDGRLKMARSLERMWRGVVMTRRRFQRPQHVIKYAWQKFDTPLQRRTDLDWTQLEGSNEFGMQLTQVTPTIKSTAIQQVLQHFSQKK
jgi:hypothetical protein